MHVNVAKEYAPIFAISTRNIAFLMPHSRRELKTFHTTSDQKSYAIYCVSGEVMPSQQQIGTHDDEAMELDDEDDFDDGEEVLETRIVLVAEDSLQGSFPACLHRDISRVLLIISSLTRRCEAPV